MREKGVSTATTNTTTEFHFIPVKKVNMKYNKNKNKCDGFFVKVRRDFSWAGK